VTARGGDTTLPPRRTGTAASALEAEAVDWHGLKTIAGPWKALAGRALEPNVYADPDFMIPALEGLGLADRVRGVCIWRTGGSDNGTGDGGRRLEGLMVFTRSYRWGLPLSVGDGLMHAYSTSSAPLISADDAEDVLRCLLAWLGAAGAPFAMMFPQLPGDGPLFELIGALADETGLAVSLTGRHERAVLDVSAAGPDYLTQAVKSKTRSKYRRLRKRLGETGVLVDACVDDPGGLAAAVQAFLKLEAAGWKGRQGTAMAAEPATAAMIERIVTGLAASGQCRIEMIELDDAPVSMMVSLGVGDRWWIWKIAYDEAHAKMSPGVLLALHLTEAALKRQPAEFIDSCAAPGHPMIERIWTQRRPFADMLLVSLRHGRAGQALAIRLEAARRKLRGLAKALRDRLRGG